MCCQLRSLKHKHILVECVEIPVGTNIWSTIMKYNVYLRSLYLITEGRDLNVPLSFAI